MAKGITSVGMDAHKVWIKVAILLPREKKPVEWRVENEKASVRRMVRKVQRLARGDVRFCFEAGPCGYALQRWIREQGVARVVVAPSLIPLPPPRVTKRHVGRGATGFGVRVAHPTVRFLSPSPMPA